MKTTKFWKDPAKIMAMKGEKAIPKLKHKIKIV